MKLLRTIALDPSDTFVFDVAAEPGDWAVSGAFRFYDRDPPRSTGKDRTAFRSGFLGVQSWGWSTLVQIVHATAEDRRKLVDLLASQLVDNFGAPDLATARPAAEEEVAFVEVAVHASDLQPDCGPSHGRRMAKCGKSFRRLQLQGGAGPPQQGVFFHGNRG